MRPTGRDVEALDLCALVLTGGHVVKGVGRLEPQPCELAIQSKSIGIAQAVVEAIEEVFLIPLGMDHLKLRRIKEAPGVQAVGGNEISPLLSADGNIE